jgi:tetratricopeptide (TPR) repeat protein
MDPLNLGVYRLAGTLAAAAGDMKAARRAYRDIVELAPHQPEALRLAGALFSRLEEPREALHLYRLAHQERPADPCYALELSQLLIAQGKHERALQILGGIESLYSGRQPLLAVRAMGLLDELSAQGGSRRRKRAIRQLRRMLKIALPEKPALRVSVEWDPLLGPLELALVAPDDRRVSRADSWGKFGERFYSACHAATSIDVPQPQKGTYRIEASLPPDHGDRPIRGELRIWTKRGQESRVVPFRIDEAGRSFTIARVIAR